MEEIWKPVKGFEGIYDVSNMGNVRETRPKRYRKYTFCDSDGCRPVTQYLAGTGYKHVRLRFSKRSLPVVKSVHSLVAEAFIGPRPEGKVVNHMDLKTENNKSSNLEYIYPRENRNHGLLMRGMKNWGTGVSQDKTRKGRYRSDIMINNENIHLGVFASPEEAHAAYMSAVTALGESKYASY